jgi:hypothetical protein
MELTNTDDKFVHEIMLKSKLKVPFSDFDDSVFQLIKAKKIKPLSVKKEIRLSWGFFIMGSVFGILISLILPTIQTSIWGLELSKLTLPFQIAFAILFVSQLNNLIDLSKRYFLK